MLRICDLSKLYGRTAVLRGLNLELKEGTYCLFGPNGSGKTTLLKTIAGFEFIHRNRSTTRRPASSPPATSK
ncbi:MAG: AAA family ATPase, partial [Archaeoglobaceae archaeon]